MSEQALPSRTQLVLIPSFNTGGPRLVQTVRDARRHWSPVWVVVDGSTDGSAEAILAEAGAGADLRVFVLPRNLGKGAAILHGAEEAMRQGFTHVLTMDSDGQHPADRIPEFMQLAAAHRGSMILGDPIFDESAPSIRVRGRRLSNWWVHVETLWGGIGDSLFGFRVYPLSDLVAVMHSTRYARRFDFDAEAAVRLFWRGIAAVNCRVPVRYLRADEGGVSQFRYVRDNCLLTWMHLRLVAGFLLRLPLLAARRLRAGNPMPNEDEERATR